MRSTTVASLDGADWWCKGYLGEEWLLRRAFAPDSTDVHGWVGGRVPGSVLDDLVRAGAVPDPLVDRNSLACEWVADRTWVYRRDVELPEPVDGAVLEFDGIDHAAQVFLNGVHVGDHAGAFSPARFDVGGAARAGRNLVAVVIAPAPDTEPHIGRTERVRVVKSRMTYGWDFCPRLVHQGIWDHARLVVPEPVRLHDLLARPDLRGDVARLHWRVGVASTAAVAAELSVELRYEGAVVASAASTVDLQTPDGVLKGSLDVENPALWWPNGHGAQPLYELRVRLRVGGVEEHASATTAFRRVELVANEEASGGARPYTFMVNGRRVHVQGWNWVPMHVHHGVEDHARLDHLLGLAARAGANLLRVWGGGLIERASFYERCDRLGLMIWQEFPLSSSLHGSVPSDDPAYVDTVLDAARQIVARRRNHASLVLWCGGNELDGTDGRPARGSEPVLVGLEKVVGELDPDRPWLPTSPTGPAATFTAPAVEADPDGQHDVHGPWEHQGLTGQHELYARATSLFHSEFGVEGMADRATIEAYLSPAHRWPADRSNPHVVHRGDFWVNTPLLERIFGPIGDLPTLVAASQLLQADGLRTAIESNRRRQWRNSGSIPWQLNEPFPNVFCTSAVDHTGRPKAAYYAVAQAYADLLVSAELPTQAWAGYDRFRSTVWASSHHQDLPHASVDAALRDATGRVHHRTTLVGDVRAAASVRLGEVSWPLDTGRLPLFWLDLALHDRDGRTRATSRWLCSGGDDLRALRQLPSPRLRTSWTATGRTLEVRNVGDQVAVDVRAVDARPVGTPGYVWFDAGNLTLFPGERVSIGAGATGTRLDPDTVTVAAWNIEKEDP